MLNAVACDAELAEPLGRGASTKCQVRAPVIVLMLPLAELLGELSRASKDGAAIELILVGSVTALDLPVAFRATSRDVAVREAEIAEVPSEVGAELGAMVGLDPLNGRREAAAQFVDEVGRRADRVVRIGSASLRQWP